MPQPFGKEYARYYDAFYRDKDFQGESDLARRLIRRYAPHASTLLELGSGTGNYTQILSKTFQVTAIEKSPHMLVIARKKMKTAGVRFILGDARAVLPKLTEWFDACVGLFHVVNYFRTKQELSQLLRRVQVRLKAGGLLVIDSWNADAVLRQRPSVRVKRVELDGRTIVRVAEPTLRISASSCDVLYRVFTFRGRRLVGVFDETHSVRYYSPTELRAVLDRAGFDLLRIMGNTGRALRKGDWSMLLVARRR